MQAAPLIWGLDTFDRSRRIAGRWLDAVGMGPSRTPSRTVLAHRGFVLKTYDRDGAARKEERKSDEAGRRRASPIPPSALPLSSFPPILILPAPIKRAYIWDLAPGRSVVGTALRRGWRVYLVEWQDPGPHDEGWGLDRYAEEFTSRAVEAVRRETGSERVVVFSHSLGGTLAAIWASLHPDEVAAMVLLESPLHFGRRDDAFAPVVAAMPSLDFQDLLGNVPGSFLDVVAAASAPEIFQTFRIADSLASLADPAALMTHWRVERWSCDQFSMPGRLLNDIVERLYRDNQYMSGRLTINGRLARPAAIQAPVLSVIEPHSRLITRDMVLAFHSLLPNSRSSVLAYSGEIGVGLSHVGPLVGARAHRELWPRIFQWLAESAGLVR